jgi:hypothetical protein
MGERLRIVLGAQAAYYVATGAVPLVSRRLFEAVTGPKRDWWLVQTLGGVICVVGAGLASAAARDRVTPEVLGVAAGSAAVLGASDVWHVARRRIAPVYLLDAAVEGALLAAYAATSRPARSGRAGGPCR